MAKDLGLDKLRVLPKGVLLSIAISLDPDVIKEEYEEGWTKDDIIRAIERHASEAIGNRGIEGWQYIEDVDIIETKEV